MNFLNARQVYRFELITKTFLIFKVRYFRKGRSWIFAYNDCSFGIYDMLANKLYIANEIILTFSVCYHSAIIQK